MSVYPPPPPGGSPQSFGVGFQGFATPPPSSPPKRRRRWGLIIAGIVVGVVALGAVVGGGVLTYAGAVASEVDPEAEGRTPGVVTFEADAGTYEISVVGSRRGEGSSTMASSTTCAVALSDGTRVTVDGRVQAASTTVGRIASVGSFEATAGPTTVACEAAGMDVRFIVDDRSDSERLGMLLLFVGLGLCLVSAAVILLGVFVPRRPQVG
jgi:F0F1-type ATP synthase membrane subunit c/vacuolar-type H+-ATPase subunit K